MRYGVSMFNSSLPQLEEHALMPLSCAIKMHSVQVLLLRRWLCVRVCRVPATENAFSAAFQKWQGEREKDLSAQPLVRIVFWLLLCCSHVCGACVVLSSEHMNGGCPTSNHGPGHVDHECPEACSWCTSRPAGHGWQQPHSFLSLRHTV